MENFGYNLLMLLRVTLAFLVLYLAVPALLTKGEAPADGLWDRLFAGLIHATLLTNLIVHLLVACQLYETFSLLAAYGLLLYGWRLIKRKQGLRSTANASVSPLVRLLDATEHSRGLVWGVAAVLRESCSAWATRSCLLGRRLWREPFAALLPLLLLLAAAKLRLAHAFTHAAYSASDAYEHLAWTKYLGMNRLYVDGIYPSGYHAVISALAKLSFIDPYWLIRFYGGIGSALLVATVFYFTLRLTKSHAAALVSLAIYGLVSDVRFPSGLARQTAALPQEYSLAFGLAALYFLSLFLEQKRTAHLVIFLEAVVITVLIHPYTTLYLLIWSALLASCFLLTDRASIRPILQAGGLGALAVACGSLPLLVGRLLGKPWFGAATQFVWESIGQTGQPVQAAPSWRELWSANPYLNLLLLACGLIWLIAWRRQPSGERARLLGLLTISLTMGLLYRASDFGWPQLSEQSRTGVFLAPFIALSAGTASSALSRLLTGRRRRLQVAVGKLLAIAACAAVLGWATPPLPPAEAVEYDAAARNYLSIKQAFPVSDWTIIAPSEQFQQALGIGWHFDLLRFVQQFSLEQAADPAFQLPIPTRHIFFFVETKSLLDQAPVSAADVSRRLEPEGPDPYSQYYRSVDQRHLLFGKAWRWMEAYRSSHDGVSIFHDDGQLLVYHVVHQPAPVNR